MKNRSNSAPTNTPVVRAARRQKPQVLSQSLSRFGSAAAITAALLASAAVEAPATVYYWDTDGSDVGNSTAGANLGGTGTWDTGTSNWWDGTNPLTTWGNTSADTAIFTGAFSTAAPSLNLVTLGAGGVTANKLSFFRSGYTIASDVLTLAGAGAGVQVNWGEAATISSQISGTDGFTKTGGGTVRLSNAANNYTGTTTISNGALVISNPAALGSSTSAVVVTGFSNNQNNPGNQRSAPGGSLVLDGLTSPLTFTRDLTLQGFGATNDRGGALVSVGNNTISGNVSTNNLAFGVTNIPTGIISNFGTLTLSGGLNVLGTGATTFMNLGGTNTGGAGHYLLNGTLSGTGSINKQGSGVLVLSPSSTAGFSGTIRVGASAGANQSSVRISGLNVLGTRTSATTGSVIDLNGGTLEILQDAGTVAAGGAGANVYARASSNLYIDRSVGGSAQGGTITLGAYTPTGGQTFTFNNRNGYGLTFTGFGAPQTTNNNFAIANNLTGGTLTLNGTFWQQTENTGNRTFTFSGNGNTLITGNVSASAAAFDHNFTKAGTGILTITSTGSNLDGSVNVQDGTLAIADFRSVNNAAFLSTNGSAINLGNNTTTGTLSIVGSNLAAANASSARAINMNGTSGGAAILANQTGTTAVNIVTIGHGAGSTGTTAKTLTLGGVSTAANTISGVIANNASGGVVNLTKNDLGTWALSGSNTYTGTTTITAGTLRLLANAPASSILADTSSVVIGASNVQAVGTLELVGRANETNVETIGGINISFGHGNFRLTPGAGTGAAQLIAGGFLSAAGTTFNVAGSTGTGAANSYLQLTTGSTGLLGTNAYFGGSQFAYRQADGILRAPVYGTDAGFVTAPGAATLPAGISNFDITGNITAQTTTTASTLRFSGSQTLAMSSASQNLTLRTGAAGTAGGILVSGGTAAMNVGGVTTGGGGTLNIRVDGASDLFTLGSTIASTSTAGWTKSGAGTLVLAGANAQTGTNSLNEGTVRLSGTGTLGASTASLTQRQGTTLDLNGAANAQLGSFNTASGSTITNTSTAAATLTTGAGGGNGTGSAFGVIQDGAGIINMVKQGTGGQTWGGLNTYTGSTTINSTGIITINTIADGGVASSLGASSSAAGNLVFSGTSATQAFGGISYTGTAAANTNRLFTINGGSTGGARIQANGTGNVPLTFSNTGAIVFAGNSSTTAQGLVLGGASTGDNRFFPQITNAGGGTAVTSVYKADAGVWHLMNASNTYTGSTFVQSGTLSGDFGTSIPNASNIVISGGALLMSSGNVTSRSIGTGANNIQWTGTGGGGFAARDTQLSIDLGPVTWGAGTIAGSAGFLGAGNLTLGSTISLAETRFASDVNLPIGSSGSISVTTSTGTANITTASTAGLVLGQAISGTNIPAGAVITAINSPTSFTISANATAAGSVTPTLSAIASRTITVNDNGNTGADFSTMSGVISGGGSGFTLIKAGAGILSLTGNNTYSGVTNINAGTLIVNSLGSSTSSTASSVGVWDGGNATAITIGNGTTGGANLQYVGTGEVSDRKIRLNATTATSTIYADGTGPLILTNVANDVSSGAKSLTLRGASMAPNMITSVLSDSPTTGALTVTVDGSATWILAGANTYTGNTNANSAPLGIGNNSALGTGTLVLNNGIVFAHGADRTLTNTVSLLNNTTPGFTGDYNLTFTQPLTYGASANSTGFNNNLSSGKVLTFGGVTADAITDNRSLTIDGTGDTLINGTITTTSTNGIAINKTGNGTLTLATAGSTTFNQRQQNITVTRGTLRIGANESIPNISTASGGIVFNPNAANNDSATFDLNGFTETVNSFNTGTGGPVVIDNTSTSAASLIVGANDAAVTFGVSTSARTITNSGGGALSITKAGNTTASIPLGYTLTHTGTTASTGGTFTIASTLQGTSGLSATGNSTLNVNAGITGTAVKSITVDAGSTLSLAGDNAGNQLSQLTSINLGVGGAGTAALNLNIGDGPLAGDGLNTDTLTLLTGGSFGNPGSNKVVFNLSDAGLNPLTTYTLLDISGIGGGLTGFGGFGTYLQGTVPGGFSGFTWNVTDSLVQITTGTLITGASYFNGTLGGAWNAGAGNWATDKANTIAATSIPGQGTDVIFTADNISGGTVATTLEQNFKIASLTFEAGTNTPSVVTVAPGALATNRLEVAAQTSTAGIAITAGGPAAVTISAPLRLTNNQTINIAGSTAALNLTGALFGATNATIEKIGAGKVTFAGTADATFNTGGTSAANLKVSGGAVELTNAAGLGTVSNSNLATITLNGGAFYYSNTAAATLPHPLTFNGGTLGGGLANHTYSGAITTSTAATTVNLADGAGVVGTTARNITLSGVISGSGGITVDGNTGATAGNQLNGTLTINNAGNTWSGPLGLNRGTVTVSTAASPNLTVNDINYNSFGRAIIQGLNGATLNRSGALTYAAGAVGEFQVDNTSATLGANYTVNQNGVMTLNSGSIVRFNLQDTSSNIVIGGGIVLNGAASLSVAGGDADSLVTISGTGISGSGPLNINDEAGAWGVTSTRLQINAPGTYSGGTTLNEGFLILGNKDALGTGALTITGASTLQASTDLSGANTIPNALTLNAGLTVSGANSITIGGTTTGAGNDADRTLTNNLTSPAELALSAINLGAAANTAARTLTIAGTAATDLNGVIADGNSFSNNLQITNTGLTTIAGANTYSGTTTMNAGAGTLLLQGSNSSTGATTLTAGRIQFDSATNGGLATGTFTISGGTIQALNAGRTITSPTLVNGTLTATGAQNITFAGLTTVNNNRAVANNLSGGTILRFENLNLSEGTTARTLTFNAGTGTNQIGTVTNNLASNTITNNSGLTIDGAVFLSETSTAGRTLNLAGSAATAISGVIADYNGVGGVAGSLTVTNTGLTTLSGANTYSGTTTMNAAAGTLLLQGSNSSTGATTLSAGKIQFDSAANGGLATGTLNLNAGTIEALNAGRSISSATIIGGNFTATGAQNITFAGTTTQSGGNRVITNSLAGANTLRFATLNLDTGTGARILTVTGTGLTTIGTLTGNGGSTLTNNSTSASPLTIDTNVFLSETSSIGRTVTFNGTGDTTISGVVANNATSSTVASSITKSGTGILLLSNAANSYTGNTTINAGILRAGANNVLSNGSTVTVNATSTAAGALLDLNNNSDTIGALTIGGTGGLATSVNQVTTGTGTLTLGGDLTVNATGNWTTSPVISGNLGLGAANRLFNIADSTGTATDLDMQAVVSNGGTVARSITKIGAGTLLLNAANTYTGGTDIRSGIVRYGVNNALPSTGTVTVNATSASNVTLDLNNLNGTIGALNIGGTGGVATSVNQVTTGTGTLTLGGDLTVNATGNWTTSPVIYGNLGLGAGNRLFNIADSTGTATDLDMQAIVSNGGTAARSITKIGAGTLVLNAANTYTGGTDIRNGIVRYGVDNAVPSTGTVTVNATAASNVILDLNNLNGTVAALILGGTGQSASTAAQSIVQTGTGTLTVGGNVTFTATNNPVNPALITGNLSLGAANRSFDVSNSTGTVVDLDVPALVSGTSTAAGITKFSAGTLRLSNTNTYTGSTILNGASGASRGVILATANNALGNGGPVQILFNTGTLNAQVQLSGGISLNNASWTTTGTGADAAGVTGTIRSIAGANTVTGNLNLAGGGGSSTYRADTGASLTVGGFVGATSGSVRDMFLVGGGDFIFDGVIRNSNQGNVADRINVDSGNTGTTTLNGINTYTGTTTVQTGSTLIAGSSQAFGVNSASTVAGTLRLAGFSNSLGSLSGSGLVENASATPATLTTGGNNATTTFGGVIQDGSGGGSLALTKVGTGAMTLSGVNTYTGITTVNNGTVRISADSNLGAAPGSPVANQLTLGGGTLQNTGSLVTLAANRGITLTGNSTIDATDTLLAVAGNMSLGTATLTSTGRDGAFSSYTGDISGTGGLTVSAQNTAGHTAIISPATGNTFTGATTVNQNAILNAQNAGALGGTSGITLNGGTALNAGGTLLLSGTGDRINDSATLTLVSSTSDQTNAPKFQSGGLSETLGSLTLSGSSSTDVMVIDLMNAGTGIALNFAASNLSSWTGQLQIWNFAGVPFNGAGNSILTENSPLVFGSNEFGLTASQLSSITFFTDNGSTSPWGSGAFITTAGQVVPVPEPTGVAVGLALFGLAGWRERRRSAARRREERASNRL